MSLKLEAADPDSLLKQSSATDDKVNRSHEYTERTDSSRALATADLPLRRPLSAVRDLLYRRGLLRREPGTAARRLRLRGAPVEAEADQSHGALRAPRRRLPVPPMRVPLHERAEQRLERHGRIVYLGPQSSAPEPGRTCSRSQTSGTYGTTSCAGSAGPGDGPGEPVASRSSNRRPLQTGGTLCVRSGFYRQNYGQI